MFQNANTEINSVVTMASEPGSAKAAIALLQVAHFHPSGASAISLENVKGEAYPHWKRNWPDDTWQIGYQSTDSYILL